MDSRTCRTLPAGVESDVQIGAYDIPDAVAISNMIEIAVREAKRQADRAADAALERAKARAR